MTDLWQRIDALAAETTFAGVVRVDQQARAYGLADRAHGIPNTVGTRFCIASGTKAMTALTVVSLIADGRLTLDTSARSVLGADLPLIGADVTVEHLLAHLSGIGDYVDEESDLDVNDYALPVPVHQLVDTEAYLTVLGGHPPKFTAGDRFAYCNGGYVVLALIAERCSGTEFPELVRTRVCEPAGMTDTAFLRSDELGPGIARGYLGAEGLRTNIFHLPVLGSGDGGIYSTATDIHALWSALFDGRIVSREWVREMTRPHSEVPAGEFRYGLGFWLHPTADSVLLEGADAGVSFRSTHDPSSGGTCTVLSNTSEGAWPIARMLAVGDVAASDLDEAANSPTPG